MTKHRGFTLVELLVVLAVIGILIALIVPAVQQARERARVASCQNNLKQIGVALHTYEASHRVYPPGFVRQHDGNPPPPAGASFIRYRSHWTGFHMLLPYLDRQSLYDQYDWNGTWLSSMTDATDRRSWALNQTVISTFLCPSAPHIGNKIGAVSNANTGSGSILLVDPSLSTQGSQDRGHWMSGAPCDYSFSHGADINRALPGRGEHCSTGVIEMWSQQPPATRGAFGYSSSCRVSDILDGPSNTFLLGEKGGGLLTYAGWNSSFPELQFEYPWAMAAVMYFGSTGGNGEGGAAWVAGPFAATADIKLPDCPDAPASARRPYPINPFPRRVPPSSDERPFYSFQSAHSTGAYFLFGDGSVRFIQNTINQDIYEALSTIAGGETF